MTTTPALRFTAKDMIARMHERLDYARADLKQAELRGYSPDFALGRVLMLAGLLASFDPALAGDDGFVSRMADVSDVDEYYTPGGAA